MRIRLIAPIAAFAALALSACSDSPLAPLDTVAGAAEAKGSSSSQPTSSTRIRVFASLTPPSDGTYRNAKGKASWDTRDNNAKREFEIEVEHLPAGLAVEFFLDGVSLGHATTDSFGEAELEFSTQLGQLVPTSVDGSVAEVRTADGMVIVTGSFPGA